MPVTTADIKKAKEFWVQLKERAQEYEDDHERKPWFRMNPVTIDMITQGGIVSPGATPGEVVYQGYRLIADSSLEPGRVKAEDGIKLA